MKKICLIGTMLLSFPLFSSTFAYAAVRFNDSVSIDINPVTSILTVTGEISSGAGELIDITVLKPEYIENGLNSGNFKSVIKDMRHMYSQGGGFFSFDVAMDKEKDITGDYTVIIKNMYAENSISQTYFFANATANEDALNAVKDADNVGEMHDALTAHYKTLGLIDEVFTNADLIFSYILDNKSFDTLEEFLEVYETAVFLRDVSKSSAPLINDVLSRHSGRLDADLYDDYVKLSPLGKTYFSEAIFLPSVLPYKTLAGWEGSFKEAVIVSSISTASGWTNMLELLTKYSVVTQLSALDSLGDKKAALLKDMLNIHYTSSAKVNEKFNALLDNYLNPPASGGTGGGGGGGSSSGGSVGGGSAGSTPYLASVEDLIVPNKEVIAPTFTDISEYAWAKSDIENLAALGIINGKASNEFAPGDYIMGCWRRRFLGCE